jgi:hypothetical protein
MVVIYVYARRPPVFVLTGGSIRQKIRLPKRIRRPRFTSESEKEAESESGSDSDG